MLQKGVWLGWATLVLCSAAQLASLAAIYNQSEPSKSAVQAATERYDQDWTSPPKVNPTPEEVDSAKLRKTMEGSWTNKQREEWVCQMFELDTNEDLTKNPDIKKKLVALLLEFFDVLSVTNTDYGCTSLMKMKIRLKPGSRPVRAHVRPLNPSQLDSLTQQVSVWLSTGVIQESHSDWSSAMVPALKKSGKIRWAVDYRPLNEATIKDCYPLPSIGANLHQIAGSRWFSSVDATGAYHSMAIAPEDTHLTAFVSPLGLYEFKRTPFGLSNAPAEYSRLVMKALQGNVEHNCVLHYLDDILCHTDDLHHHLVVLRTVLMAHRRAGMRIQPAKTKLFRRCVDYLGHQVSQHGIGMIPSYIELLVNWPTPQSASDVRIFLGKCNYYRTYIPTYETISGPLDELRNTTNFIWTAAHQTAFEDLKKAFLHGGKHGILAYPDFRYEAQPFILDTDWCLTGMSYLLSQVQHGKERLIAANGRKPSKSERNYSSPKGELLAG